MKEATCVPTCRSVSGERSRNHGLAKMSTKTKRTHSLPYMFGDMKFFSLKRAIDFCAQLLEVKKSCIFDIQSGNYAVLRDIFRRKPGYETLVFHEIGVCAEDDKRFPYFYVVTSHGGREKMDYRSCLKFVP